MKKGISDRSLSFNTTTDILSISTAANEDKLKFPQTINASIGVFLNDDRSINGVDEVKKALNKFVNNNLGYPPVLGQKIYKEAVLKWLFKDEYQNIIANYKIPFGATIGGTGALLMAFNIFANYKDTILFPSYMWTNYLLIAHDAGLNPLTYEVFKDGHFNTDGIIEALNNTPKQENTIIVVNDPCQNPTGYTMTDEEYDELILKLNKIGQERNLTVIFDIAYLDYDITDKIHRIFKKIIDNKCNFLPLYTFSASKTFGLYGARVGALFAITTDEEVDKLMVKAMGNIARGTYSCPNGPVLASLANMLLDEETSKLAKENIYQNSLVLNKRGEHAKKLIKQYNINCVPYSNGFYMTLIFDDAYAIFEKLKTQHIYVVPMDEHHIRVCISSIREDEMDILFKAIGQLI
ncbi:MAG: aminotransferase class I/II-fold pyridoxal phosphate-dependent enzyme [Bacilli bacterium]|nr:aminotransferase class I/II-fold pyridoxal phosphate-dependent enzyme [Bacilli bacterium]